MNEHKKYLETILKSKGVTFIQEMKREASTRQFYRFYIGHESLVAMLYPTPQKEEVLRIARLTKLYKDHGINVPEIKDIIDHRIIIQEDLGNMMTQKAFALFRGKEREDLLETIADIIIRIKDIPTSHTDAVLDKARMKWEMDFFLTHFAPNYLENFSSEPERHQLKEKLHRLVDHIGQNDTFAHRDFHTRNMMMVGDRNDVYLVDFQDSLVAPLYYDLISFAFDSYLDLGHKDERAPFLERIRLKGMPIDEEQLHTTALQRNIKALGTFGFQVTVRKHLAYKKYINRTLRHITSNPLFNTFFKPEMFALKV
jgi:N-acetylmuramate 1-kinase